MKFLRQFLPGLVLITNFMAATSGQTAGLVAEYQINDHGQTRAFVVATNELYVMGKMRPERILPAFTVEDLQGQAQTLSRAWGKEVRLVLYGRGSVRTDFTRRLLTRDV